MTCQLLDKKWDTKQMLNADVDETYSRNLL